MLLGVECKLFDEMPSKLLDEKSCFVSVNLKKFIPKQVKPISLDYRLP